MTYFLIHWCSGFYEASDIRSAENLMIPYISKSDQSFRPYMGTKEWICPQNDENPVPPESSKKEDFQEVPFHYKRM